MSVSASWAGGILQDAFHDPTAFSVEQTDSGLTIILSPETNVWLLTNVVNMLAEDYEVELSEEPGLAGGEEYRLDVYDTDVADVLLGADEGETVEIRLNHKPRTRSVRVGDRESVERGPGGEHPYTKIDLIINGAAYFEAFIREDSGTESSNRVPVVLHDVEYTHLEDPYMQTEEHKIREEAGYIVHAREEGNGR